MENSLQHKRHKWKNIKKTYQQRVYIKKQYNDDDNNGCENKAGRPFLYRKLFSTRKGSAVAVAIIITRLALFLLEQDATNTKRGQSPFKPIDRSGRR